MRILGIDPGSRLTGYGCIEKIGSRLSHLKHGTFRLIPAKQSAELVPMEDRLFLLYKQISLLIQEVQPNVMVIEKVFFAKNPMSTLKLSQVRGALLLIAKMHAMKIAEYNPTEVKRGLTGYGQTNKEQIARVLQLWMGSQHVFKTWDASDGLALAIYHAQRMKNDWLLKR